MIAHLMVPGLARRHLDADWLDFRGDRPSHRADLVCTFPASIETVEATLLTGVEPATHGHRGPEPVVVPWLEGCAAVAHRRDDRLSRARRLHGDAVEAQRDALRGIAELIDSVRSTADALIVTGGPAFGATPHHVDAPAGFTAYGSIALGHASPPDPDAWLATPGIARVLTGDALRSWHGHDVGAALVAETGWSFAEGACACGRRDLDGTDDGAVLLGWNVGSRPWPRAVHDVRIAPTLATWAGTSIPGAVDKPLRRD